MEHWVVRRVQSAMLCPVGPAQIVAAGDAGAVLPREGRGMPREGARTAQVRLPEGPVGLATSLVGKRPVAQCAEGVVLPQRARRLPRRVRHGEVRSATAGDAGHRHALAQMAPTHRGSAIRCRGFRRPHRRLRRDPQLSRSSRCPERHPGQPKTGRRRGVPVRARVRRRRVELGRAPQRMLRFLRQCPKAAAGWAAPPATCTATG